MVVDPTDPELSQRSVWRYILLIRFIDTLRLDVRTIAAGSEWVRLHRHYSYSYGHLSRLPDSRGCAPGACDVGDRVSNNLGGDSLHYERHADVGSRVNAGW